MRTCDDRRRSRIATRPADEEIADWVDAGGETARRHPVEQLGARPAVLRRQCLSIDAAARRGSDPGQLHVPLPEAIAVDGRRERSLLAATHND